MKKQQYIIVDLEKTLERYRQSVLDDIVVVTRSSSQHEPFTQSRIEKLIDKVRKWK